MEEPDELLDIVDAHEAIVWTIPRLTYYKDQQRYPGYLRSAELFLRNKAGELWIPRRLPDKQVAPNGLDYSCGGHLRAGESYKEGIAREAAEELNLKLVDSKLQTIYKFTPTDEVPYFHTIFMYVHDTVPDYNKRDFHEYFWLQPQELLDWLQRGEPAKSSLLPSLQHIIKLI